MHYSFLISPIVLLSPNPISLFSLNSSYYQNVSHLCAIDSTPFSSLFKPYSLLQQFRQVVFSCAAVRVFKNLLLD